jgi:SOS-response transcriptional repressor LexA
MSTLKGFDYGVYHAIEQYIARHGFGPCIREIMAALHYNSSSETSESVLRLIRAGLIEWPIDPITHKHLARTMRLKRQFDDVNV